MIFIKPTLSVLTILFVLFLCITNKSLAVNDNEGDFNKVFDLIYNQQFYKANTELIQLKNKLDKWEYHILNLELLWWEALSGNSREDYDRFESALSIYSHDLHKAPNPDRLEELIILSYSFRLKALNDNLILMIFDFMRINHIVRKFEIDRLNPEQKEIFKIYLALVNIGKSKFFFNNSRLWEEGIEILENNLASSNTVCQAISQYFLSKIYLEMEQSPAKARIYCEQLCNAYPANKIFIYNLELCMTGRRSTVRIYHTPQHSALLSISQ